MSEQNNSGETDVLMIVGRVEHLDDKTVIVRRIDDYIVVPDDAEQMSLKEAEMKQLGKEFLFVGKFKGKIIYSTDPNAGKVL